MDISVRKNTLLYLVVLVIYMTSVVLVRAGDDDFDLDGSSESLPENVDEDLLEKMKNDRNIARGYLIRFGYMGPQAQDPKLSNLEDPETEIEAIRRFQRTAGRPETGKLDEDTLKMMTLPRCGVTDIGAKYKGMRRKKRFALEGSRWNVKQGQVITWNLESLPSNSQRLSSIPEQQLSSIMSRALKVWSGVADVNFRRINSQSADINMKFASKSHGDGNPFDGTGGTLAHAFFPRFGGDAHFDDDERFTDNTRRGTNLFQVAAHEFGHSLGLAHSTNQAALMAPFYRGYQPNFKLHDDDTRAIQGLYGRRTQPTRAPTPAPTAAPTPAPTATPRPNTPRPQPQGCDVTFDAIASAKNGRQYVTLVFSGDNFYEIDESGAKAGFPKRISNVFPSVSAPVDAALANVYRGQFRLFLFKGAKAYFYYRTGASYTFRGSISISNLIADGPSDIDSIFSFGNYVWIFKGNQYYKISRNRVLPGYPKSTSQWNFGSFDRVSSASVYSNNGLLYFFVGSQYYRYGRNGISSASPSYPRSIGEWWMACRKDTYQQGKDKLTTHSPSDEQDLDLDFVNVKTSEDMFTSAATFIKPINVFTILLSTVMCVVYYRQH